jgi:uncharacterized membrane protein
MPELLTLAEALHWIQVGFCFAVGFGIASGIGWLLWYLGLAVWDKFT